MLTDFRVDDQDLYFDDFVFDLDAAVKNAIRRLITPGRAWHYHMRSESGLKLIGTEFQSKLPETLSHPITSTLVSEIRGNLLAELSADKRLDIQVSDVFVYPGEHKGTLGLQVVVRYQRGTSFLEFTLDY